jgi:hypothetical protein
MLQEKICCHELHKLTDESLNQKYIFPQKTKLRTGFNFMKCCLIGVVKTGIFGIIHKNIEIWISLINTQTCSIYTELTHYNLP